MPSAWPWSQYELMQGHAGTSQIHEVNLVNRSRRRRMTCKIPGSQGAPWWRLRSECSFCQHIKSSFEHKHTWKGQGLEWLHIRRQTGALQHWNPKDWEWMTSILHAAEQWRGNHGGRHEGGKGNVYDNSSNKSDWKEKNQHYVPILIGNAKGRLGNVKFCTPMILLGSGASY